MALAFLAVRHPNCLIRESLSDSEFLQGLKDYGYIEMLRNVAREQNKKIEEISVAGHIAGTNQRQAISVKTLWERIPLNIRKQYGSQYISPEAEEEENKRREEEKQWEKKRNEEAMVLREEQWKRQWNETKEPKKPLAEWLVQKRSSLIFASGGPCISYRRCQKSDIAKCADCSFSVDPNSCQKTCTPFGCSVDINFPVSIPMQKLLAQMVEADRRRRGEASFGYHLLNRISKQITEGMARCRQSGMYFEGNSPIKVTVKEGFLSSKVINTDEIFGYMFAIFEIGKHQVPKDLLNDQIAAFSGVQAMAQAPEYRNDPSVHQLVQYVEFLEKVAKIHKGRPDTFKIY